MQLKRPIYRQEIPFIDNFLLLSNNLCFTFRFNMIFKDIYYLMTLFQATFQAKLHFFKRLFKQNDISRTVINYNFYGSTVPNV